MQLPKLIYTVLVAALVLSWPCGACAAPSVATSPPPTAKMAPVDIGGTISTPDGKPCAGAHVVWIPASRDSTDGLLFTTSDADGKYRFDGQKAWTTEAPGGYVFVKAAGYGMVAEIVINPAAASQFKGRGLPTDLRKPDAANVALLPGTELHIQFLDEGGSPVAGAHIRPEMFLHQITSDNNKSFASFELPKPVGERQGGVTGADGTVVIPNLPQDWQVRLQVDDPQYAALTYAQSNVKLATDTTTNADPVRLQLGGTIEGTLTYAPTRKPAAGIMVHAVDQDNRSLPNSNTTTGPDGHYRIAQLPPGQYSIRPMLKSPLNQSWASHGVTSVVKAGGHHLGADITLIKGAVITGKVTDKETGKGIPQTSINISSDGDPYFHEYVRADAEGRYRVCVPGGSLTVVAYNSIGMGRGDRTVDVKDGETKTLDLTTVAPPPPMTITGSVLDSTGKPVADAEINARTFSYDSIQPAKSDAEGKFSLTFQGSSSIIFLSARQGNRGTPDPVPAVGHDNVTLRLADNILGTIAGSVTETDGTPVEGATVSLSSQSLNASPSGASMKTDALGVYQFTGLMPDLQYSVYVSAMGYGSGSDYHVNLPPGQSVTVKPIALPRANSFVAGTVLDTQGKPLANVTVEVNGADQKKALTDSAGRFRIEGVAPGKVYIQVHAGDQYASNELTAGKADSIVHCYSTSANHRSSVEYEATHADKTGTDAPEMRVAGWVNTPPLTMAGLRGKYVIFDIWGCCADRLPQTQTVVKAFGNRGVVGIGLRLPGDSEASGQSLQAHAATEHLTIPLALDSDAGGQSGVTAAGLGSRGFESYALVDRNGTIAYVGFDFNALMTILGKKIAAEKKP